MRDFGILRLFDGRPKLQDQIAEFLGKEPDPSGGGRTVLKIHTVRTGFMFEWHPITQRVFLVRMDIKTNASGVHVAECIAQDIVTHGEAVNAANIFNRGFEKGQRNGAPMLHLQGY